MSDPFGDGCAGPGSGESVSPWPPAPQATTASPTETPNPTALAPESADKPAPQTEHRIGVRVVDGAGEFYDRQTGKRFVPRGYNHIHLASMSKINPGLWHSTLNPGLYEPERAEAAMQSMHAAGYNTVRIFVDCCREGNNAGDPKGSVSLAYLGNVIDFLKTAEANQINDKAPGPAQGLESPANVGPRLAGGGQVCSIRGQVAHQAV